MTPAGATTFALRAPREVQSVIMFALSRRHRPEQDVGLAPRSEIDQTAMRKARLTSHPSRRS
eukprot:3765316-Pyramimonas_sp.AAC.1